VSMRSAKTSRIELVSMDDARAIPWAWVVQQVGEAWSRREIQIGWNGGKVEYTPPKTNPSLAGLEEREERNEGRGKKSELESRMCVRGRRKGKMRQTKPEHKGRPGKEMAEAR